MTRMKFSQREARRLKRRVFELEQILAGQRRDWSSEWPSSALLHRIAVNETTMAIVRTARALNHAIVVVPQDDKLALFADRISGE